MKLFLSIVFLVLVNYSFAQVDTGSAAWKLGSLPRFSLLKTDSTLLTEKDLKPGKCTIIMLFSPDCEHCQKQIEMMLKKASLFKDCQLILATTLPMPYIRDFVIKYKTDQFPFIRVGQDSKFFFGPFFKLQQVPMLAFYNRQGKLKEVYHGGADMKKIKRALSL
jgi:hypothetical protein